MQFNTQIFSQVKENQTLAGHVYVLIHPHMACCKVGHTRREVEERMAELAGTGVPGIFEVYAAIPVSDPTETERIVHQRLVQYRVGKTEFFSCSPYYAAHVVRDVARVLPDEFQQTPPSSVAVPPSTAISHRILNYGQRIAAAIGVVTVLLVALTIILAKVLPAQK